MKGDIVVSRGFYIREVLFPRSQLQVIRSLHCVTCCIYF